MKYTAPIALVLAVAGGLFSHFFQDFYYWTGHSMFWFFAGAISSYLFAISAMVLALKSDIRNSPANLLFNTVTIPIAGFTVMWTTLVIGFWLS